MSKEDIGRPEKFLPIELRPQRLVVIEKAAEDFIDEGSPVGMVQILRSGTEMERSRLFETAVGRIADNFVTGSIKPRELSKQVRGLCELDDSKDLVTKSHDYTRILNALEVLSDEKFQAVTSNLPTSLMEKLRRPDLEVCSPKRMAGYIRNKAYPAFKARVRERRRRGARFGRRYREWEILVSKRQILEGGLLDLLDVAAERDNDKTENPHFLYDVALNLINPDIEDIPPYVKKEIEELGNKGSGSAEDFLGCFRELSH